MSNEYTTDIDSPFLLDWRLLEPDQKDERIEWLRVSLTAGEDWGYCDEMNICVLKTSQATVMYRLRWFTPGGQEIQKISSIDDHNNYCKKPIFSTTIKGY